jgi:hypothetical protein
MPKKKKEGELYLELPDAKQSTHSSSDVWQHFDSFCMCGLEIVGDDADDVAADDFVAKHCHVWDETANSFCPKSRSSAVKYTVCKLCPPASPHHQLLSFIKKTILNSSHPDPADQGQDQKKRPRSSILGTYKYSGSTSNAITHLQKHHKSAFEEPQKKSLQQAKLSQPGSAPRMSNSNPRKADIDLKLLRMITLGKLPLSFVESAQVIEWGHVH